MDQQLGTVGGGQAHGVTGGEHGLHGGVTGSADLTVGGDDCDAVAQQTLGEGGVGDFRDRNGLACHGSKDVVRIYLFLLAEQVAEKAHFKHFLYK